MRKIKFRAMYFDGQLVYGVTNLNAISIVKETLEQFTGLRDKNGKEIYEGDVISTYYNLTYKVIFNAGCFGYFDNSGYWHYLTDEADEFEVIGNIHEEAQL